MAWERCGSCGCEDGYTQKRVPRNLFLAFLMIALGIALYVLSMNWWLGMGILFGLAAIDFVLYHVLPSVAVCYQCGAWDRNGADSLPPFDPHIGERYRTRKQKSQSA